ncbi:MAG: cytochrome c [Acidobacteriota bacterium]|jgi:mono/diheme cytochrome c family protein
MNDETARQSRSERPRSRKGRWTLIGVVAVLVLCTVYLAWRFTRNDPVVYEDIVEHYKYGSLGSEAFSPPYWVWKALPVMFPEYLPGDGYESLGFVFEEGEDLPIGFSRRRLNGLDGIGLNCAFCHTGTVRDTPDSEPRIYVGMPAHQFDIQGYFTFLFDAALDQRFTPNQMIPVMESLGADFDPIDRAFYRYVVINQVRLGLLEARDRLSALILNEDVPPWGLGRVDTFNPYKALQLNYPMHEVPTDELIGPADYPQIWNQAPREGLYLHWDGNNNSVDERNLGAALGTGATPTSLDYDSLDRIDRWLREFPPPEYPYDIDRELAGQGEVIYQSMCSDCHDFDGELNGTVIPLEEIGTDPYRLHNYTYDLTVNQATLYAGMPWRFTHWRKSDGYACQALDGIWARAPYLHNGSVPTLRDLLEPPENRPAVFYRGYDVYDRENVGFVSDVPEANGREFFRMDRTVPGNDNVGHLYGTDLSPEEKDALIEYMKTL